MKPDVTSSPLSTAAQYILLALADRDLHGYGILLEITELTQGSYSIGPGTLYDNLRKLMDNGWVVDAPRIADKQDDERRFYQITGQGREVLAAEIARLKKMVAAHARAGRPKHA